MRVVVCVYVPVIAQTTTIVTAQSTTDRDGKGSNFPENAHGILLEVGKVMHEEESLPCDTRGEAC